MTLFLPASPGSNCGHAGRKRDTRLRCKGHDDAGRGGAGGARRLLPAIRSNVADARCAPPRALARPTAPARGPRGPTSTAGRDRRALMDASTWFAGFHVIQLALTGLVGLSVLLLADGFGRANAWVTRLGVGVFLVFFSAYEAVAGIATGLAMRSARDLSAVQQEGVFHVVRDWPGVGPPFALSIVGTLGWVAAVGPLASLLAVKARRGANGSSSGWRPCFCWVATRSRWGRSRSAASSSRRSHTSSVRSGPHRRAATHKTRGAAMKTRSISMLTTSAALPSPQQQRAPWFWLIGSSRPSQYAQPLGSNPYGTSLISPRNGSDTEHSSLSGPRLRCRADRPKCREPRADRDPDTDKRVSNALRVCLLGRCSRFIRVQRCWSRLRASLLGRVFPLLVGCRSRSCPGLLGFGPRSFAGS